MTEELLDESQTHAGFEKVRGIAVAQRVNRDSLAETQLFHQLAHARLDTVPRHGVGGSGALPNTPVTGGKEPDLVPVRDPELAEHGQGPRR
jgi:hypothetical protein